MFEEQILTAVSIGQALDRLEPIDRDIICLAYAYERPDDYRGAWPPTLKDIGQYVGIKYADGPFTEGRIRLRRNLVLLQWRTT